MERLHAAAVFSRMALPSSAQAIACRGVHRRFPNALRAGVAAAGSPADRAQGGPGFHDTRRAAVMNLVSARVLVHEAMQLTGRRPRSPGGSCGLL